VPPKGNSGFSRYVLRLQILRDLRVKIKGQRLQPGSIRVNGLADDR
jgi:hypothetical protein